MQEYSGECRQGREEAAALLRRIGGDMDLLPEVVSALREAVADKSGRGVGALTLIAAAAISKN